MTEPLTVDSTLDRDELAARFVEYARSRNKADRDKLVEAHLGLAAHLARRFARRGESLDDLEQVAMLALVKAVDRFDPERGLEFSTFAVPTIVGELKRHFRDRAWAVRVPRRLQELHLEIAATASEMTHELSRSPTIPELATRLGVTTEDIIEALDAGQAYRSDSLDAPAGGGSGDQDSSLISRLGSDDGELEKIVDREQIDDLLATLPERERTIVRLRFFGELSQSQIAERVGISQMHVSRLLSRSLERLRMQATNSTLARED
jgi:RNA polymerase sigma-B factor